MKEAWRECAIEIRAKSGLGTGLLERALEVGDGTGRSWRRWMAPEPPMPRKLFDLIETSLQRGWVSNQAAQGLLDAVQASAGGQLDEAQAPCLPSFQIVLPFVVPPDVPSEVLLLNPGVEAPGAPIRAATAARLLVGDAIQTTRRAGAGLGSGGAKSARHRKWLEATVDGKEWLAAIKALRRTIERLGLSDRPGIPGHPGGDSVRAREAARQALEETLQAAYERLGYPPPPMQDA